MTKLIYIVSSSYSGSTLLDLICGSVPGIFSMGEIHSLSWELHRDRTENNPCPEGWCTCLKKYHSCTEWGKKIIPALSQNLGYDVYLTPYRFKLSFTPRPRKHKLDMFWQDIIPRSCLRVFNNPYSAILANSILSLTQHTIAVNSWTLFDTISQVCNITHVVDSSKSPLRMLQLYKLRPKDTYPIVLIRDIRGVAHSKLKRGEDPFLAAKQWIRFYQQTFNILSFSNAKWLLLKYEDLCENPIKERQRIATFCNKGDAGTDLHIDTRKHHLVGGNAMRYKGNMNIRPSSDWRRDLPKDLENMILKQAEPLFKNYPVLRPND